MGGKTRLLKICFIVTGEKTLSKIICEIIKYFPLSPLNLINSFFHETLYSFRIVGENVTYSCPGIKMGERDSKSTYKAACLQGIFLFN